MIYRFEPLEMKVSGPFGYRYRWGVKVVREGKSYGLCAYSDFSPREEDWVELERDLEEVDFGPREV